MARIWLVNALVALCLSLTVTGPGPWAAETGADIGAGSKIFMLGDSLTAGWGVENAASLPDQLEARLKGRGHKVRVVNGGVSGDTTAGGKARIGWALKDKPDAVIVALGGNDALRGLSPRATRRNLDVILSRLKEAGLPVLLAGYKAPRNLGPEYIAEFEAVYPELAKKHGVLFYPFILDGVAMDPALNQGDGIHPNAEGVARMVDGLVPLVEKLMARIKTPAPVPGP
ncbi:MAG: arylesterase [Alphaproteobacteria bacterium]|nr:arylesterase [Alphaproteobacteria bacterium]